MEIANNPNISFSWHPGAFYSNNAGWAKGCLGERGQCGGQNCGDCYKCKENSPSYKQITKQTPNPEELAFYIRVKNKQDYELVKEFLEQNQQSCQPYFTKIEYPTIRKESTNNIKPEYQEKAEKIHELLEKYKNDERIKTLYEQLNQINTELIKIGDEYTKQGNEILGDLSCKLHCDMDDPDDYVYLKYSIPYPEMVIYEDNYNVEFKIFCMKGSKFYDEFLEKYDLIAKNWPSWYDKKYKVYVTAD